MSTSGGSSGSGAPVNPATPGGMFSGFHWYPISPSATASRTFGAAGVGLVAPVLLPAVTISAVALETTVIGDVGSLVRPLIYRDSGAGSAGALLADVGTVPGDAVAVSEITLGANLSLPAGWYWLGAVGQNYVTTAPTVRASGVATIAPGTFLPLAAAVPVAGGTAGGSTYTGLTGALPASLAAVTPTVSSVNIPRLIFKLA